MIFFKPIIRSQFIPFCFVTVLQKSINRIGSPHGECETGEDFQNVFNTEYSRQVNKLSKC